MAAATTRAVGYTRTAAPKVDREHWTAGQVNPREMRGFKAVMPGKAHSCGLLGW